MADPLHAFISYRRQEPDSPLAHEFAQALEKAGHEVFIDTGIRWGANWAKEIREALERSEYLVLLLSREAAASEMVMERSFQIRSESHRLAAFFAASASMSFHRFGTCFVAR